MLNLEIQRANMWKRISAWLLDAIMFCIIATGFGALLSITLNYDTYYNTYNEKIAQYEQTYNIKFELTQEEYTKLQENQEEFDRYQKVYNEAYQALASDQEARRAFDMVVNLSLTVTSLSIFLSVFLLDFLVPLLPRFGNGQTIGKKIFGLALVTPQCVKIRNVALFTRAVLGKYTIELMIPVLIAILLFFGNIGLIGPIVVIGILIMQAVLLCTNRNRTPIHDLLANTVVVDLPSQRIFPTEEDLLEYKKAVAAEAAEDREY